MGIGKRYRVKERYINDLRLHLNESDPKDKMTKKYLKQLKVGADTDNVQLLFDGSIIRSPFEPYWPNKVE